MESQLTDHILHTCTALNKQVDINNSIPVIPQVELPYTTCSFQIMFVSMHKMTYQKGAAVHFWRHKSSFLTCSQIWPRKGKSLIVEWSFGVPIICVQLTFFEWCMKKKRKKDRRKSKMEIFAFNLFDSEKCLSNSWRFILFLCVHVWVAHLRHIDEPSI